MPSFARASDQVEYRSFHMNSDGSVRAKQYVGINGSTVQFEISGENGPEGILDLGLERCDVSALMVISDKARKNGIAVVSTYGGVMKWIDLGSVLLAHENGFDYVIPSESEVVNMMDESFHRLHVEQPEDDQPPMVMPGSRFFDLDQLPTVLVVSPNIGGDFDYLGDYLLGYTFDQLLLDEVDEPLRLGPNVASVDQYHYDDLAKDEDSSRRFGTALPVKPSHLETRVMHTGSMVRREELEMVVAHSLDGGHLPLFVTSLDEDEGPAGLLIANEAVASGTLATYIHGGPNFDMTDSGGMILAYPALLRLCRENSFVWVPYLPNSNDYRSMVHNGEGRLEWQEHVGYIHHVTGEDGEVVDRILHSIEQVRDHLREEGAEVRLSTLLASSQGAAVALRIAATGFTGYRKLVLSSPLLNPKDPLESDAFSKESKDDLLRRTSGGKSFEDYDFIGSEEWVQQQESEDAADRAQVLLFVSESDPICPLSTALELVEKLSMSPAVRARMSVDYEVSGHELSRNGQQWLSDALSTDLHD